MRNGIILLGLILGACKKNDEPVTGFLAGVVTDAATGETLKDVRIILFNANTNAPVGESLLTDKTGSYQITNVPDGTYLGRASYANDTKVMDPDWIVKNGEPYLTVSGEDAMRSFSITGAVELLSPTNESTSVTPVSISTDSPVFTWEAYPSTSDYVIEVTDANGNVIWGGFSEDWSTKYIVIPSSHTSIIFNEDMGATSALEPGEIYRWKIYASKNDVQSASGFRLISSSEDQRGLFRITE